MGKYHAKEELNQRVVIDVDDEDDEEDNIIGDDGIYDFDPVSFR